jgi:hypothetical protein
MAHYIEKGTKIEPRGKGKKTVEEYADTEGEPITIGK